MKMTPESEEELAAAVAGASGPLRVVGGGTRPVGKAIAGDVLSAAALSGVSLYEPGALTIVAGAGTPVADIDAVLAEHGQRLAFEPMDHRALLGTSGTPTIGGVVAANVSGPRRIQVGACRDFLLGVRFVDGQGRIIKNGGRVMKNVTGYDLVKLMAGSHGTLGVLSELSFKVQAIPKAEATLVRRGLDAGQGVAALSAALASPYDVSGAAHVGAGVLGAAAQTCIRVEGMEHSVAYRAGQLGGEDWQVLEGSDSAALWRDLRDVTPFAARAGAVWRVSVKPSDGPVLCAALTENGLEHAAILDWGGGLVWLLVDEVGDAGAALIRQQIATMGGHATLVRAAPDLRAKVPVFEPQAAPIAALAAGLRARFDPRAILNPGLMG
jgi:glycolate dehydrogenase FAD-binding subunit